MLAVLVRCLEERDHTEGHGARVAALAEPVARLLGWSPDRIAVLRHAAPIHDVGKLVVRPDVLLKPGALSNEERREMRAHPRAGASLVLPLPNARHLLPYDAAGLWTYAQNQFAATVRELETLARTIDKIRAHGGHHPPA